MRFCCDIGAARPARAHCGASIPPLTPRPRGGLLRLLALLAAAALGGCSNGAGSLLIDPGRYSAYHCNDLAARWKVLLAREKELRELMDRAAQGGGGGAIIGSLAYRTDYESVRSEEMLLQRTAADKNCNPATQFQSDQIIR
jgi:hypothetical protein